MAWHQEEWHGGDPLGKDRMTIDTVAYVPADADESDAIAKILKSLNGSTIKLHSAGSDMVDCPYNALLLG